MKHIRSRTMWIYLALGLIGAFVSIGAWAGGFGSTGNHTQQKPLSLVNRTSALTITKAELEPNGRTVRLAVTNATSKPIDWFRISLGPGSDVEADFAFADKSFLGPNESYEDSYPVRLDSDKVEITIVSVVFEDRSSDGDVRSAQRLINKRRGQAIELKRVLPLITQITNTPDKVRRDELVASLERRIAEGAIETSLPEATQEGVTIARERVLDNIRRTKDSAETDMDRWRKMSARYERIGLKLKQYGF
jgi:hypothetical protein